MLSFFTHAENIQELTGSPAYLESIQDMFAQDQSGGMIDIAISENERLIYLYHNGALVSVYRVVGQLVEPMDLNGLYLPPEHETRFRYLQLPSQAVRAVWQALSWLPVVREARLNARQLADYLDSLRTAGFRGQVYCRLPDWDGLLIMDDGFVIGSETVLASSRGFLDNLPNLRSAYSDVQGECWLWLIEARPNTLASQMLDVRLATADWVSALINNYQGLVGSNLVIPLNHVANVWFRQRHYNARLVGSSLIDHHLSLAFPEAIGTYNSMLKFLTAEVAKVIGASLSQRALVQSFRAIKARRQRALQEHGLAPDEAGVK